MKKVMFTLLACGLAFGMANAKEITIKKAATAPNIDGDIEDFVGDVQAMDQKKGDGPHDNTASFQLTYDDNFVYVAVKVEDPTMDTVQSANVWEKDCVEVFFVLNDTVKDGTSYSNGALGAWQLRKIWGRDMTDQPGKGFKAEEGEIAGGYTQEWKLSWDTLAATGYWGGKQFRFECQNGDNDGSGRKSQNFWNSNADDQWSSILNQGTVKLETAVPSRIVSVSKVKAASSMTITSNGIQFNKAVAEVNVYDITGKLVIKANNTNFVSTAALRNGVYVVKAGNESKKFIK
ncbi:MAG TPA: sugar-binding protein [Bacteroidales bacterium]